MKMSFDANLKDGSAREANLHLDAGMSAEYCLWPKDSCEMKFTSTVLAALVATSLVVALHAQVKERPIPRIVKKDGRFALLVDGAPYLVLGGQVHNSSTWPAMLPKVWPAMEDLNVNTVEMPIYWEQFEPRPGQYDYTTIDTVLTQARQHHVSLCCSGSERGRTAASTTCRSG